MKDQLTGMAHSQATPAIDYSLFDDLLNDVSPQRYSETLTNAIINTLEAHILGNRINTEATLETVEILRCLQITFKAIGDSGYQGKQ